MEYMKGVLSTAWLRTMKYFPSNFNPCQPQKGLTRIGNFEQMLVAALEPKTGAFKLNKVKSDERFQRKTEESFVKYLTRSYSNESFSNYAIHKLVNENLRESCVKFNANQQLTLPEIGKVISDKKLFFCNKKFEYNYMKPRKQSEIFGGKIPVKLFQQVRSVHTAILTSTCKRRANNGLLLTHGSSKCQEERNSSSFLQAYHPVKVARGISSLQPSKAGFNVRKLAFKATVKDNWDWSLPSEHIQYKTEGPKIDENLINFIDQKMRSRSVWKKKYNGNENKKYMKVRMLINKAKDMNKEAEKIRLNFTSSSTVAPIKSQEKKTYRTVPNVSIPKMNETTNMRQKESKERYSFPQYMPENKSSVLNEVEKETKQNLDSSPTEYQSSASYRDVFYNIFNKTFRKKAHTKRYPLSVFNRPALESGGVTTKPAAPSTVNNSNTHFTAMGKKEKSVNNETKKSQITPRIPLKETPRSPFQKVKDTLLAKPSKASFSTTPIIKQRLISKKTLQSKKQYSTSNTSKTVTKTIIQPDQKLSVSENNEKLSKTKLNLSKKVALSVPKASYSTHTMAKNFIKTNNTEKEVPDNTDKIFQKKDRGLKTGKYLARTIAYYHGRQNHHTMTKESSTKNKHYNNQWRNSVKEVNGKSICHKRSLHTNNNPKVNKSIEDNVLHELLNICGASKKSVTHYSTGRNVKEQQDRLLSECRSLNERKDVPAKKKGLLCSLAGVFKVGCGRESKCPSPGCCKCGK